MRRRGAGASRRGRSPAAARRPGAGGGPRCPAARARAGTSRSAGGGRAGRGVGVGVAVQPQREHVEARARTAAAAGSGGRRRLRLAQRPFGGGDVGALEEVRERPAVGGEHRCRRRRRHARRADQEPPAGEPGRRRVRVRRARSGPVHGRAAGVRGSAVPGRTAERGCGASRTAVGEPSAARTLRRAGAGAGGTCSGMVGRLSLRETRRMRGRCGRRCRRAEPGAGVRGGPGPWASAPTLCLVRGVYTTRVHTSVSSSVVTYCRQGAIQDRFLADESDGFALGRCRSRPGHSAGTAVGRNSRSLSSATGYTHGAAYTAHAEMHATDEAAQRHDYRSAEPHGGALWITQSGHYRPRRERRMPRGCPVEEGHFDGGEGRGGRL